MKRAPPMSSIAFAAAALACLLSGTHCAQDTSRLTPDLQTRFQLEGGVVRRADNVIFHYTRRYGYRREEHRENRLASIIVTPKTVLIHKNEKVGVEITDRSHSLNDVHRRGPRVLVYTGKGEIWSFEPESDTEGWTRDIRAVIRGGAAAGPSARRGRSRTSPG